MSDDAPAPENGGAGEEDDVARPQSNPGSPGQNTEYAMQPIEDVGPVETADEGSNTNQPETSTIGAETDEAPGEGQITADQEGGEGDAPDPAAAEVASTSRPPSQGSQAAAAASSRPASATAAADEPQQASTSRPASRGSAPATPPAAPAAGSRPASGTGAGVDADVPAAGSRPASGTGAGGVADTPAAGSRPASATGAGGVADAPTAGSRPASSASVGAPAAGSRPASQAGAAPPASSSRPGTAGSTAAPSSRPGSSMRATPEPGAAPAASSRPTTSEAAARPPSQPSAPSPPPPAAPRPPSRPASVEAARASPQPPPQPVRQPSPVQAVSPAAAGQGLPGGVRAIDVEVSQGPGLPVRMVRVLLDSTQLERKPFLGGYKNKKTAAMYHHACTQTPRAPKYANAERKLERTTQTVKIAQRSQQTVREAATQMERPGVIVDTSGDRPKTPGRYQTSEERLAIVTAATRTIQRYFRGFLGRKRAAYLKSKKREREAFLREQEARAQVEAEEHRRREIERRMHPRTAADFEILYNELEAWRLQETRKIKEACLPKDKEQEVLQQLLHKETKLLQTIDRLKINANHENKDVRIQKTLNDMSKPKKYELRNGSKVEVHTPFTTRAKELQQLYNGLNLPMLTIDERLDVLLHVKWTVKEFDCNLTREIVELIDREADLLNRGRSPKMLEGLRKRISSLFLNFIETPEFNPEAVRFQIVPMDFETYLFEKLELSHARSATISFAQTDKWDA